MKHGQNKTALKKIAIVADKNRVDNLALCKMLEADGYTTAAAFSAKEAINIIHNAPRIDLIIIDSTINNGKAILDSAATVEHPDDITVFIVREKYYSKDHRLMLALN